MEKVFCLTQSEILASIKKLSRKATEKPISIIHVLMN